MSAADPPIGFLLCDDLMFSSRITGTGRDLGYGLRTFRSAEAMLQAEASPRCVIVDLANPGLHIAAVVAHFKKQSPPAMIVAYGSHVDAPTLQKAREAGCDVVWPRSKFVQELPSALPQWFAEP
jgi:DNA-binding NarL/FixJ family response regulator